MLRKPLLKRNQPQNTNKEVDQTYSFINTQNKCYASICPPIFLTDYWFNFYKPKKIYWNLLTTYKINFPHYVSALLLKPDTKFNIQSQYMWCYNDTTLFIWHYYESNYNNYGRKYNFDRGMTAAYVGSTNWGNERSSMMIVAIAFNNLIQIFQLFQNKLCPLEIVINTYSPKIIGLAITNQSNNQLNSQLIVFVDSQGYLGVYDLEKRNKAQTRSFRKILMSQLVRESDSVTVLDIKILHDRIYTLLKVKTNQRMWSLLNIFGGSIQVEETIIKVYQYKQGRLAHLSDITSSFIYHKLKESFQDFFAKNVLELNFSIHAINPMKEYLQIIFECGYMINVKDTINITFVGGLYCFPSKPTKVGVVTLGDNQYEVTKKVKVCNGYVYIADSQIMTKNSLNYSFGTLEQNDQALKIVKLQSKGLGKQYRVTNKWAVMTKSCIKILIELKDSDIMMMIAYVYSQLVRLHQLTNNTSNRINNKIKSIMSVWGGAQMMSIIIEMVIYDKDYKIQVQTSIYESIRAQLTDNNNIKEQTDIKIIYMNEDMREYLWGLIFRYHNNKVASDENIVQNSDILWNGLMIITTQMLSSIRNKTPEYFISNRMLTMQIGYYIDQLINVVEQMRKNYHSKYSLQQQEITKKQNNLSYGSQNQIYGTNVSTFKLIEAIIANLPKIKSMITVYQTLTDYKYFKIPTIQNVMENRQSRVNLTQILIQCFDKDNQLILDGIEEQLPDLEMRGMRIQQQWKNESQKYLDKLIEGYNQGAKQIIILLINTNNIKQIQQYFQKNNKMTQFIQILKSKIFSISQQIINLDKIYREVDSNDIIDKVDKIALERQKQLLQIEKNIYASSYQEIIQSYKLHKIPNVTLPDINAASKFNFKKDIDDNNSIVRKKTIQRLLGQSLRKKQ